MAVITRSPWARFDDHEIGSRTTVLDGKFYLVRLEDGSYVALSWKDPKSGCTVPWRPNFRWPDPTTGIVREGWFREPCYGSTYDQAGIRVFGPATRNMDRFVVNIVAGQITVDTSQYVCGFSPGPRCAGGGIDAVGIAR